MRVYEGAGDIIWAAVRCGPRFDQIAAFSENVLCIWNHDASVPVQVLPAEHEAHRDAELVVSPDGRWLVAYGHQTMRCWQSKRDKWELRWETDDGSLFLARFGSDKSDLLQIDFQEIEKSVPGVILSRRSLNSKSQAKKRVSAVATSEN